MSLKQLYDEINDTDRIFSNNTYDSLNRSEINQTYVGQ